MHCCCLRPACCCHPPPPTLPDSVGLASQALCSVRFRLFTAFMTFFPSLHWCYLLLFPAHVTFDVGYAYWFPGHFLRYRGPIFHGHSFFGCLFSCPCFCFLGTPFHAYVCWTSGHAMAGSSIWFESECTDAISQIPYPHTLEDTK